MAVRSVLSATEARVHFGDVLRRVADGGEVITVERSGRPLAVMISIAEYEQLQRLRDDHRPEPDWWELTERSRAVFRKRFEGRPMPDINQLFDDMRDERDERLLSGVLISEEVSPADGEAPAR